MQRRRELMAMQTGGLPGAYRRVEYLESSGTQYIYTDIQAKSGIECSATVMWLSGSDATIFGARKASTDRILLIHQYPSRYWTLGYGSSHTNLAQFNYDTVYNVESKAAVGEQYFKVDGVTVYTGTDLTEYINNFNMALFACTFGNATEFSLKSNARIYGLVANVNGQKAADFIPCVRKSDSKPGMYDTISKTFYTNAGTGEFIVPA